MMTGIRSHNCTVVHQGPECDVFLWKAGTQIEINGPIIDEISIDEIHVKPDGAHDDKPSLAFVMQTRIGLLVLTQITFESIWPAIEAAIKSKGDLA